MNALQKIKLSKELLATTASLKGGQLKALEKIKASKRALEIVGLLGGGSVKTPIANLDLSKFKVRITSTPIATDGNRIPDGWIVFNASRPLIGDITWKGDFLRGVHYAAVNPNGEFSKGNIVTNSKLDASIVRYLDEKTIQNMYLHSVSDVMRQRLIKTIQDKGISSRARADFLSNNRVQDLPYDAFNELLSKAESIDFIIDDASPDTSKKDDYDNYIKIAADSIEQLRKIDVERVLQWSELKGEELSAFGDYIIKNRPDLEGEVNDLVGEMFSGGTRQPRDKDFTTLLNSIINGDVSVFDDKAKLTELVGAAQEVGGDNMPDDKKDLFIEAVKAAGIQQLEGTGFL